MAEATLHEPEWLAARRERAASLRGTLDLPRFKGAAGWEFTELGQFALAAEYRLTAHIRARGEEIKLKARTPGWRARRWVVEAAHSWLNRNRAILIRWSKKDENHLALLQLASGLIAFKKAHAARLQAAPPG